MATKKKPSSSKARSKPSKSSPSTKFKHSFSQLTNDQKISLTSIAIIAISITLAFWTINISHQNQLLSLENRRFEQEYFSISSELPTAQSNSQYHAQVTASAQTPQSHVFLSVTELPSGLSANCFHSQPYSHQDFCDIFGIPVQAGKYQVLITVFDKTEDYQYQEWLPLTVNSTQIENSFKTWFSI